jgi:predicted enzyme related to lactoylglutathione lyase
MPSHADRVPLGRLAYANVLARDIEALSTFYSTLLGFAEIESHRSPIYRCLDAGGMELGFNAPLAIDLLGLAGRGAADGSVRVYLTFELTTADAIDLVAERVVALGGRVIKLPYLTYYNARQAVLEDPEGNVFRVNHRQGARLPADEVSNPPWADK